MTTRLDWNSVHPGIGAGFAPDYFATEITDVGATKYIATLAHPTTHDFFFAHDRTIYPTFNWPSSGAVSAPSGMFREESAFGPYLGPFSYPWFAAPAGWNWFRLSGTHDGKTISHSTMPWADSGGFLGSLISGAGVSTSTLEEWPTRNGLYRPFPSSTDFGVVENYPIGPRIDDADDVEPREAARARNVPPNGRIFDSGGIVGALVYPGTWAGGNAVSPWSLCVSRLAAFQPAVAWDVLIVEASSAWLAGRRRLFTEFMVAGFGGAEPLKEFRRFVKCETGTVVYRGALAGAHAFVEAL